MVMAKTKCAVGPCSLAAKKHGMCVVHALTWLLTPDSVLGPDREARRLAFIARQETRHALKAAPAES